MEFLDKWNSLIRIRIKYNAFAYARNWNHTKVANNISKAVLLQKYYWHTLIGHLVFSLQNPVYKWTSTSDNIVFLRNCNSYSQFVIFLLFIFTEFGLCRAIAGRAYRGISYQKFIGKFAGNDSIIFKDLYYKSLKSNKIWPAHSFLI